MTADNPDNAPPEKPKHRRTPPATPAVQAWLDGEVPREGLATPDEQETAEFWSRINSEADQLRRRTTPIHVQQKILNSIPNEPAVTAATPARPKWSSITLSIPAAILVGAAVFVVAALIAVFFLRQ